MDIIKKKKKALRAAHVRQFNDLEKYSGRIRMAQHLYRKAKEFFKTCDVSWNEGTEYHNISITLREGYNITEHVNIFVDEWLHLFKQFKHPWRNKNLPDYDVEQDDYANTVDYKFGHMSLYIYYGSGNCKRVKVGQTSQTIKKDIYEIQCY